MIWIQENKGLAAFLGLCLVGCAALGFMLFGSYNRYTEAYANFESSRKSVDTLEHKSLFPDDESIRLKKEAVDAYAKEVSGLRGNLVQFQSPLDMELTGNEFQGRLAEQVERLQKLATEQKVELPEEFRLDFDRWVNQPAPQMAVPKLDFQLEAIGDLVTTLIDSGISQVTSVTRSELPEESGVAPSPSKKKKPGAPVDPLVERYPVELVFQTSHEGLVNVINTLSNASMTPENFFIIRLLEIQNEVSQGPLKEDTFVPEPIYSDQDPGGGFDPLIPSLDPGLQPPSDPDGIGIPTDPGLPVPVDPAPVEPTFPVDPTLPVDPAGGFPPPVFGSGTPEAFKDARILLGEEKLNVFLKVEIVRFKPKPPEEEEPAKPGE